MLSVKKKKSSGLKVRVATPAGTEPGDYMGELLLTNQATGDQLHVPVWVGVRPLPTKDVLLVDDDASGFGLGFADYSATYKSALNAAGVNVLDLEVDANFFPAAIDLRVPGSGHVHRRQRQLRHERALPRRPERAQ